MNHIASSIRWAALAAVFLSPLLSLATPVLAGEAAFAADEPSSTCIPCAQSTQSAQTSLESHVHAALGPVYAPIEPDFLELIESEARRAYSSGEWQARMSAHRRLLLDWADRPVPGLPSGEIPLATRYEVRRLATPFAQLKAALRDARPGLNTNPDNLPINAALAMLARTYLFIDGDDPAQRAWAAAVGIKGKAALPTALKTIFSADHLEANASATSDQVPLFRLVLLKGSLGEMRRALVEASKETENRSKTAGELPGIYFDQAGHLRRLFRITSVPALVTLTADEAVVQTIPIDDEGRLLPSTGESDVVVLPSEAMPLDPAMVEATRRGLDALGRLQPIEAKDQSEHLSGDHR